MVESGDSSGDIVPVRVLLGRKELRSRLECVMDILTRANLMEEAQMFYERVLVAARGDFAKIFDYEQAGEHAFTCTFKPMIELLLYEMEAVARNSGLTEEMRKERIAEAMKLAGF